jgi:hypothetical protein
MWSRLRVNYAGGKIDQIAENPVCTQDLVLYSTGPIKTPLCPQTSAAAALAYIAV